jgi:hypothetical protein
MKFRALHQFYVVKVFFTRDSIRGKTSIDCAYMDRLTAIGVLRLCLHQHHHEESVKLTAAFTYSLIVAIEEGMPISGANPFPIKTER